MDSIFYFLQLCRSSFFYFKLLDRKRTEKELGRHAAKLPWSGIEPQTAASRTNDLNKWSILLYHYTLHHPELYVFKTPKFSKK